LKPEHLPAIEAAENLELLAVYSRSKSSVDSLFAKASSASAPKIDSYYDNPAGEQGKSLDDLLARSDIAAVVVCLPILTQPEIIKKALSAGKHVLSEKPIAGDVATAEALIEWHKSQAGSSIWAVAENFRFIPSANKASVKIKEIGGDLVTFHLKMYSSIKEDNKYFNTECECSGYKLSTLGLAC